MKAELTLYVAGNDALSERAVANLRQLRELVDGLEYEIVDVLERPDLARDAKVIATPLLVRVSPEPMIKIIGDLSLQRRVIDVLGLRTEVDDDEARGSPS